MNEPRNLEKIYVPGRQENREEGSILLLVVGLALILLLIATVVIGITAVYVERQKLQSLADQLSTASAQQVTGLYQGVEKPKVQLSDVQVQQSVAEFLVQTNAAVEFEALTVGQPTGAPDPNTAEGKLTAYARVPLLSIVVPEGVPISVTSSARSELQQ